MSASQQKKKKKNRWPIKAFFLTLAITIVVSLFSETTLMGVPIFAAVLVLVGIVLVGIIFDIVGVAVTNEQPTAYNAMASKKIRGAKQARNLVKNASTISSVLNDVVGDVCGIVSGAMGAAIVIKIVAAQPTIDELILSVLVSSLVAAFTVGGKAFGKTIAIEHSHEIVFMAGKILSVFSKRGTKCSQKLPKTQNKKTKRS